MNQVALPTERYVRAAKLSDVKMSGCHVVYMEGHAIALFQHNDTIYAIDNRCPHMGFPLHKGTVKDGLLTCHWHHARFDLCSGGTFDLWADDVQSFPVDVRDDEVWVDLAAATDVRSQHLQRLKEGLEQNISLVIAKSAIALLDAGSDATEPIRSGIEFGTQYRQAGWGSGLTILACMGNLLPYLDTADRPRALYHGLAAVARDCAGSPPRFAVQPLPTATLELEMLKGWFRQFVEVRDSKGAERCLISAIRTNATPLQVADLLFAAATDHRYIDGGHTLDFTNKALEVLDRVGWQQAEIVLPSLVRGYTQAERKEESNAWRSPIDLVAILERAFDALPAALDAGQSQLGNGSDREALVAVVLGDDPGAIADALLTALREGCSVIELASAVVYAAALRIAQFNTSNDFMDWDTAHHSFTFAHAVHQGLCRVQSPELVRGIFDAAMSVYLNRFLNIPPAPLPKPEITTAQPEFLLQALPDLLDRQQQVDAAGTLVARYLQSGSDPERLLALLGHLLLREDRSFHTIQSMEAALQQYASLRGTPAATYILVAAVRYLAAHAPTVRSQGQTYAMAERLHRGDRVFEVS